MCNFSSNFPVKWKEHQVTSYYVCIFLQYVFVIYFRIEGAHEMTDLGNIHSLWLCCKQENSFCAICLQDTVGYGYVSLFPFVCSENIMNYWYVLKY